MWDVICDMWYVDRDAKMQRLKGGQEPAPPHLDWDWG